MEKFFKTPDQISFLMRDWFLSYHDKVIDSFTGHENFTFFDLVPEDLQKRLLQQADLDECEKPVFLLNCDNGEFVMNTTHRFIRIGKSDLESVFYKDFNWHKGYNSISVDGAKLGVKTDGYFAEFGLVTHSGDTVYWRIPTGFAGHAFWSVTNKCELIGRKYL